MRAPVFPIIAMATIAAIGLITPVSAEPKFFIVTEQGNTFPITIRQLTITGTEGGTGDGDPSSIVTGSDFKRFVGSNSKMVTQEFRGWIITGNGCKTILHPNDDPGCPIQRIKPYMEIEQDWEFVSHFHEDEKPGKDFGRARVALTHPYGYHKMDSSLNIEIRDAREAVSNIPQNPIFGSWTVGGASPPTVEKEDPVVNGIEKLIITSNGKGWAYIPFAHPGEAKAISGEVHAGSRLLVTEKLGTPGPETQNTIYHKPPLTEGFWSYDRPERVGLLLMTENNLGYPYTFIYGNSHVSFILVDYIETRPFSYVAKFEDTIQHVGYDPPGHQPPHNAFNRIESSHPTTFFTTGRAQASPALYFDYSPMYSNSKDSDIIFDHYNDEVVTVPNPSGSYTLTNVYSYIRIPIENFGAIDIRNAGVEARDGTFIPLDYLDGLYDPENKHADIGTVEYFPGTTHIHFPVIPQFHNISMTVGGVKTVYNYSDIASDQFAILHSISSDGRDHISIGSTPMGGGLPSPTTNTIKSASSEVSIIQPLVADRDGTAMVRLEATATGSGYIQNNKLLKGPSPLQFTAPSKGTMFDPLKASVTTYVNGEKSHFWEPPLDGTRPDDFTCGKEHTYTIWCKIEYLPVTGKMEHSDSIPGIKTGDYIEFVVTANMDIRAPITAQNNLAVPTYSNSYTLVYQYAEAYTNVKLGNVFITTQVR